MLTVKIKGKWHLLLPSNLEKNPHLLVLTLSMLSLLLSTVHFASLCFMDESNLRIGRVKSKTNLNTHQWVRKSVSIVCLTSPLRWPSWCLRCLPSRGGSSSPVPPGPPTPSPDPGASRSQPPEPEHNNSNNAINLYKAEKVCSRNIVSIFSDNQIRIIMEITKT